MDVIRSVKAVRGNFFNDGEAILKTATGKIVVAIFTDTLETRNVLTLVGESRMPVAKRMALAAV